MQSSAWRLVCRGAREHVSYLDAPEHLLSVLPPWGAPISCPAAGPDKKGLRSQVLEAAQHGG